MYICLYTHIYKCINMCIDIYMCKIKGFRLNHLINLLKFCFMPYVTVLIRFISTLSFQFQGELNISTLLGLA